MVESVESHGPEETLRIAEKLAIENPSARSYYLEGDLGAGKTLFTKGIASSLGIDPAIVTSPTFALVQRYSAEGKTLYHVDLYRIDAEREIEELGLEEMEEEEGSVLVIEWAEKLGRHRRTDAIEVAIEVVGENERRIRIHCP